MIERPHFGALDYEPGADLIDLPDRTVAGHATPQAIRIEEAVAPLSEAALRTALDTAAALNFQLAPQQIRQDDVLAITLGPDGTVLDSAMEGSTPPPPDPARLACRAGLGQPPEIPSGGRP